MYSKTGSTAGVGLRAGWATTRANVLGTIRAVQRLYKSFSATHGGEMGQAGGMFYVSYEGGTLSYEGMRTLRTHCGLSLEQVLTTPATVFLALNGGRIWQ